MHPAATAAGLGMSCGTVGELASRKIKELLGIPPTLTVTEALSIGYPAEAPIKYKRRLNSMTHREKFESQKLRTDEEIKHLLQTRRRADICTQGVPRNRKKSSSALKASSTHRLLPRRITTS